MIEVVNSAPAKAVSADERTAFARGHDAARGIGAPTNPFATGTAEHNNFAVGFRFGTTMSGRAGDIVEAFFHRLD